MTGHVGNDVVDLGDPEIASHHLRPRFVLRVCSEEERPRVRTARDLWSLFAAKEAAYKALVKLGRCPGFSHRAIVVAPDFRSVRFEDAVLCLRVDADDERVHAVAWTGEEPRSGVARDASARVRLASALAEQLACDARELEIVRDPREGSWDGYGPPRVVRAGAPLGIDVSLSHDGRFVAWAHAA